MGWLKSLMAARTPPVQSYGELARSLLSAEGWPTESRTKARSLEAILGKLDRDLELDWLAERPGVQLALAQVLSCSLSDVRARLGPRRPMVARVESRVRLEDLPFARALDLAVEPLCPGFPAAVLDPGSWRALWWFAPPGSGRSLAGRWLAARGLAQCAEITGPGSLLPRAEELRPRYLELSAPIDERPLLADGRPICVAAPFRPASEGWTIVECPAAQSYVDELVDWVAARVPDDGRFDALMAKRWLARGPLRAKRALTLGELLGFCGALDELGSTAAEDRTPLDLARRFVKARVQRLEQRDGRDLGWLRRTGFGVLVGISRRLLTDSDERWDAARPFETWLELVPPEHQRDADLSWVQASFAGGDLTLEARELERAARRLPPGAFRFVRELREAGLLVPDAEERLALRPRWLGAVLVAEAVKAVARGSPLELGEALLRPHASEAVAAELAERIATGDLGAIPDVLELETDDDPAQVAALEAIVTATGLVVLDGVEIPQDSIEELFGEQLRLLVQLPDVLPAPRVPHPRATPGSLLDVGTWLLGVVALGEQLPRSRGLPHPLLRPWHASGPHPLAPRLYDRLAETLGAGPTWLGAAYGLVDRLRSTLGAAGPRLHPLELPGALLEEIVLGVVSFSTVRDLCVAPHGAAALARMTAARGLPWPEAAAAIWSAWADDTGQTEELGPLAIDGPARELMWPHVTPRALERLAVLGVDIPFALLGDEAWRLVLERASALEPSAELRLWAAVDERHARALLAQGWPRSDDALVTCWQRFPELADEALAATLSAPDANGLRALELAPDGITPTLAARLAKVRRDTLTPAALDGLRRWAHARVARRAPGWQAAYAILSACEHESWLLRAMTGV